MKSGEYAEPYRFRPFGSTEVVNRGTGEFTPCTPELCPYAERIPRWGHHGDDHRTNILPPSKLAGQLINRAPFYWSGGLGTLIRKSAEPSKKNLLWDFYVYTNSPDTSIYDVAHVPSWLDSWRYSQLFPGDNFASGGWSKQSYTEHQNIMEWALSNNANSAYNIRLPGLAKYTRDVVGNNTKSYISGSITLEQLTEKVKRGWEDVHLQEGKLSQLSIYRSALNLDDLDDFLLCRFHRELVDEQDPHMCGKYDKHRAWWGPAVGLAASSIVLVALTCAIVADQKRRKSDSVWMIRTDELKFASPPEVLGMCSSHFGGRRSVAHDRINFAGRGTFGLVVLALYRGTEVAVKRVIPPKKVKSTAIRSGTLSGSIFLPDEFDGDLEDPLFSHSARNLTSSEAVRPPGNASSKGLESATTSTISWFSSSRKSTSNYHAKLKEEFVDEMRYLAKLRHPNITTVMGTSQYYCLIEMIYAFVRQVR